MFFVAPGVIEHWDIVDLLPEVPGIQFLIQLSNPGKADQSSVAGCDRAAGDFLGNRGVVMATTHCAGASSHANDGRPADPARPAVGSVSASDWYAISEALGNLEDVEVVTGTVRFAGTSCVLEKAVYVVEVDNGWFYLKKER